MKFKFQLAVGLCLSLFFRTQAQELPLDPAVRTGKLPNGFTYYIRHNEEPENRVTFYLANKVGSVLETDDQQGLAHFMEHMSFNGTTHFPKNELVDYLQKIGVRFGADLNAYTSYDETVYQLPIQSNDPEILKNGLQIMRDWAQEALLDPREIDKERGVVLEEKRLGKGAEERLRNQYFPTLLNNSIYAQRLPIGKDVVLNNFKPEALQQFYHNWYRPDLQALIVVGDINVDKMEQQIRAKFADLKNPPNEKQRPNYTVPLSGKNQFIVVTDPEVTSTSVQVIIKQTELPLHTAQQYKEMVTRQLFNTMLAGRFADLQQSDFAFISGGAAIDKFAGGLDSYSLSVTVKPGEIEKGFKSAWRESEKVKRAGFTDAELDRAKLSYINYMESLLKEKDKVKSDSYVKEYLEYFLHGTASPGIAAEVNLVKSTLPQITVEDVNTVAKLSIKKTDRDVLIIGPAKDQTSLPDQNIFYKWLKDIDNENFTVYNDNASVAPLLKMQPGSGKVVKEKHDEKLGIITMTLSNHIKIVLKPTDFNNNQIRFTGFSSGGTSLYSDADYQSANAANLIPMFGAGNFNASELSKFLADKQVSVKPFVNERMQGVNGSCANNNLEKALELVYAYFVEPRKDSALFHGIIERSKANLVNRGDDPSKVYNDTINAVLSNYNIRRTAPSIEKLNEVDLGKTYRIYQERFADASGFTFVFTGSIDTLTVKPLLEKYLGGLPATNRNEAARNLNIQIPAGKIDKSVFKGKEDKSTVTMVFSGAFDYSFQNVLKMDALKEILQIRLIQRLREDESGVYAPSVRISTNKLPKSTFNMTISFGCSPQNVKKLTASVLDEVKNVRETGPLKVNLDKFKAEYLRMMEVQLRSNDFWLGYLDDQILNNEDLGQILDYNAIINSFKTQDVKETAVKYLDGKNYIRIVLMPEKGI